MPELGPYGSVRGARGNSRPYRESELVGWVESFAKPIAFVDENMGIASLHPSYALRAE